jgi:SAM-dependent methyltransferase
MIKSISYSQEEIIKNILALHSKDGSVDCDPTYSKGCFYKDRGIEEPIYKFDINPQMDEVIKANAEKLLFSDCSLNTIMFDPPFLATTGSSLSKIDSSNVINKRFGVYDNELSLFKFYKNAIKEFYRILKPDGILIFKCQDKVSSGKQYFSHCFIYNTAIDIGFYPVDFFILLSNNRITAKWQQNQKHARKYHSYFWVLKKCNIKILYSEVDATND